MSEDKSRKKLGKEKKKKLWEPVTNDSAEKIWEYSHFVSKGVNTNSASFGIRLSPEERLGLPYVALRTLDIRKIPLEISEGGAASLPLLRQFQWVRKKHEGGDVQEEFLNVREEDERLLLSNVPILDRHYESPKDFVGLRLRQIVLQSKDGQDVCLTPLPSPGFSQILGQRLDEEDRIYRIERKEENQNREKNKTLPVMRKREKGFLGIGGANVQNVGALTIAMQTVLFCRVPTEDSNLRKAYAIKRQNEDVFLSPSLVREFYAWRQGVLRSHREIMPGDSSIREKEQDFLKKIVDDLKKRSDHNSSLLRIYLGDDEVPADPWLNPSLRHWDWAKKEAKKIYHALLEATVNVERGERRSLGIGEQDSLGWIPVIEEELIR